MAEGKDKIARSLLDLQPTAIVDLYKIYPDTINKPTLSINIHGGSLFNDIITWQGIKYTPVPIEAEGFEITSDGRLPRPKIRVANKDYLITNLLQNNFDFKNAQIVRKRTFVKYLDDANFDGGNPFGEADSTAEISEEKYVISQKTQENKVMVELELTSPLDLENFELNHRKILGKYCYWMYRGQGCGYAGPPIETEFGKQFLDPTGGYVVPDYDKFNPEDSDYLWYATKSYDKGDIAFIENAKITIQNPVTLSSYPMKMWYVCVSGNVGKPPENNPTYWQKDGCNKKLSSCKKRFSTSISYSVFDKDVEQDYVDITGNYIRPNYIDTGYFISKDQELIDFYTGDFTIALFLDPDISKTNYSRYFTNNDTIRESFGLENNNQYTTFIRYRYNASSQTYANLNHNAKNLQRTLMVIQYDKSEEILSVKIANNDRTIKNQWLKDFNVNSYHNFTTANCLILGANLYDTTIASPNARYYNLAIWSEILTDEQLSSLIKFQSAENKLRFSTYEDADSNLKNSSLIAWYEEFDNQLGNTLFLDSHNNHHLTGSGLFATGREVYAVASQQTSIVNQPAYQLPFGGFPGTDGFSFKA